MFIMFTTHVTLTKNGLGWPACGRRLSCVPDGKAPRGTDLDVVFSHPVNISVLTVSQPLGAQQGR